jgi:hypothetical protein
MFEILDRPLVSFGCFSRGKSPKIAPASSLGIFLARVQAILAGFQFTNHFAPHLFAFHAFDATSASGGKVAAYSRRPVRLPDSYDLFSAWHPLPLTQVNYASEGNVDMRVAATLDCAEVWRIDWADQWRFKQLASRSKGEMKMGTILLIILILLLIGALPTWPYSNGWGYYPSGGLGLVVVIVLVLVLLGRA